MQYISVIDFKAIYQLSFWILKKDDFLIEHRSFESREINYINWINVNNEGLVLFFVMHAYIIRVYKLHKVMGFCIQIPWTVFIYEKGLKLNSDDKGWGLEWC